MPRDLPLVSADILARIRARRPRVHCITNAVAQNFTANMLLAAGAVPSMTIAPDEIADFVARADALLVNLGTLDPERRGAIDIAIATAGERVPWILDPERLRSRSKNTPFDGARFEGMWSQRAADGPALEYQGIER